MTTPQDEHQAFWIVLDPDGELRCALGARAAASPVPPVVRRLSRAQIEEIWSKAVAAGWCGEVPPPGFEQQIRLYQDNSPLLHVAAQADGRRRVWQSVGEVSPETLSLIGDLRALVWSEEP